MVYDKVGANPTLACVNEGARIARENGCDFVTALGGGSVMDAAKAIALTAANGEIIGISFRRARAAAGP